MIWNAQSFDVDFRFLEHVLVDFAPDFDLCVRADLTPGEDLVVDFHDDRSGLVGECVFALLICDVIFPESRTYWSSTGLLRTLLTVVGATRVGPMYWALAVDDTASIPMERPAAKRPVTSFFDIMGSSFVCWCFCENSNDAVFLRMNNITHPLRL